MFSQKKLNKGSVGKHCFEPLNCGEPADIFSNPKVGIRAIVLLPKFLVTPTHLLDKFQTNVFETK